MMVWLWFAAVAFNALWFAHSGNWLCFIILVPLCWWGWKLGEKNGRGEL